MVTSVYYDDLAVGRSAQMERKVTEADIQAFGQATGDFNPVHFDETYAKDTLFRGRVAHGVLSVGFMSAVIGNQLPGAGTIFISANVEFKAPVRIGDTVVTVCTVKELRDRRRVVLDCVCTVEGQAVVVGEALVMAPRRPKS